MSEIVLADPIIEPQRTDRALAIDHAAASSSGGGGGGTGPVPFDSERLPSNLTSHIQRFLRVANLIEREEPRRFRAFEIAHGMDRNSNGRGVRQFKTSLLQRLEQDEYPTLMSRKDTSDTRELRRVYHAYSEYIIKSDGAFDLDDSHRNKSMNARRIATVLFQVLKTVTNAAGSQALADRDDEKSELYVPYNILPLDQGGSQHAIMQLPEIKAAVAAVRNIRGLPSTQDLEKTGSFMDLFEFLGVVFGFQEGNVANQREHLILLLASIHVRKSHKQTSINKLGDAAVDELVKKISKNYTSWCKFLGKKSSIELPYVKQEAQQHKILYIGLYLLIWGEAANLRFMPECLCYIFHHMADELHDLLTGKKVTTAYEGGRESFLGNVVTPIYRVIYEGAVEEIHEPKWLGKKNFVEIRSFWQIFRSFDRMWSFFILSLQAMIIMACHDLGSPLEMLDAVVFEDIMSIFITSAILKLVQAILDIVFTWKNRLMMDNLSRKKQVLKLLVAVIWTIVLPIYYARSKRKYTCYSTQYRSWLGELCFSSYMVAVAIFLTTNAVEMVLFFVPAIHKFIEVSNYQIFKIFSWWTQVYFMDTQIWYSVFCTIFGGVYGILNHLGEIRTLGMLRSKFDALPSAFSVCLTPPSEKRDQKTRNFFPLRFHKVSGNEANDVAKFVFVWNQIIKTFRLEDLISNWELDLMTIPMSSELFSGMVRWPIFLLANKFSTALSIARDFVGKDEILSRKIKKDKYMYCAVKECYESLKYVLEMLIVGNLEKRVVSSILNEIEESMRRSSLLEDFKMSELPALKAKCIELVELLLEGNENQKGSVVKVLQDMFELVTYDMMTDGSRILDLIYSSQQNVEQTEENFVDLSRRIEPQLFESSTDRNSIHFPLPDSGTFNEQIRRFLWLLTVNDKAMDIPANLEAQRRISFFATSLFTDMPSAPKVQNMLSFSVLTPHYKEDVMYSTDELNSKKEGVSIKFYMQMIYPDEWKNFLERTGCEDSDEIKDEKMRNDLRNWVSFRGQTLSRTVRGMMYYREALRVQAFLDMADNEDILEGYDGAENNNRILFAQLEALADLKFTYVISFQMFGSQKSSGDPHAQDILDLMNRYPSVRVAYVEEIEEIVKDKSQKVYSSILVKAVGGFDQEIYRIKLPGPPNIGEGKPENQNHAIIFTRGEALQTIDMNQDNYLEEAFKMRNLLQEFLRQRGQRPPTILGLREHIFTGSVSSLAWFMSYQETSFVTIGQRLLANPLRVRFHYGHPDVFDRLFHITRGGISKASKTINLSEDVYAGFNSTLRRGCISYHEYLQVGKGRDVGLNQISKFEAKVANGNSEQTISRDIYRLGRCFDFFRMLSCYFTTTGFYFNNLLYLVLSGLQKALLLEARVHNIQSLETALASQSFIQLGLLTGLPMVMEIGLEKGFLTAIKDFTLMQLQLAAVFFTFSLGTKIHYYGRTMLHGGAKYRPTGRKVVVFHASFTEIYRLYSRSHFVKGFELVLLLIVYDLFRRSYQSSMAYVLITYSIWFMSITWLFAPFLFNPAGFEWEKILDDWKNLNKWIRLPGGIGIQQDKSWHSWWDDEQAHLCSSGLGARLLEILLSVRFFMYQYGLVYHLDISQKSKNVLVYILSWIVILAVFLLVKAVNMGRQQFSTNYHLAFRLFKAFLFIAVLAIIIILSNVCDLSMKDLIVCCLAFLPTGWGLILIAQAARPKIDETGLWHFTRVLARAYDYGMSVALFAPVAVLAWLPIISAFQTRFLFNEAFNRHLQIQPILAGKKTKQT
uniref:1,3-beta-glucan synthase n=1 Tax=Salix viminalis TaxID=40686 RepID=A0A6N2MZZ2_SALVM